MIDGGKISAIVTHFENLRVVMNDGTSYFITHQELVTVMNEFLFDSELKKTRTWLHPVTPDVPLLYDQDRYPV